MQQEIKDTVLGYFKGSKPGRILDIPSGSCWLAEHLSDPRWEYHAADLYSDASDSRCARVDLNEDLPYENASFDYVACLEGLEHLENYHHTLREFHRILKPGGKLVVSTPNPLNVKSRLRYLLWGTFMGFPHLVNMPDEGEHLHVSPINASFLISFAERYGLRFEALHRVRIKPSSYRYLAHVAIIRAYVRLRTLVKDAGTKEFMLRLHSLNILLNDGIVASFENRP